MAYHNRVEEFEAEVPSNWVPIGVAGSYEAAHQVSLTLYEAGIESIWGHDEGSIDKLRRVLEPWPAGDQIHVEQTQFDRAKAVVGTQLFNPKTWTSLEEYLASRPTDDLVKIIDLKAIWEKEVICATEDLLKTRGQCYPPDGVNSRIFPAVCLILSIWLGIFAGVLRLRIDKTRRPATGGTRPYYNQETRRRAEMMLGLGFNIWLAILLTGTLFKLIKG